MFPKGDKHWNWKGGIRHHSAGYILRLSKDHPFANSHGYVYEHRLVMEKRLGRYLKRSEQLHHINGNKTDNRIGNLVLFNNASKHTDYEKNKVFTHQCRICNNNFPATRTQFICSNCRKRVCKICGKKFQLNVRKRLANANVYCSLACRNEFCRQRFLYHNPRKKTITPDC